MKKVYPMSYGSYLILWQVTNSDDELVALFKNPFNASDFALQNGFSGVSMILYKSAWKFETLD